MSALVVVVVLSPVDTYIVRTWLKCCTLVVVIGGMHALVLLPIALTLIVPNVGNATDTIYESIANYLYVRTHVHASTRPVAGSSTCTPRSNVGKTYARIYVAAGAVGQ
jgi:hypothetical protein